MFMHDNDDDDLEITKARLFLRKRRENAKNMQTSFCLKKLYTSFQCIQLVQSCIKRNINFICYVKLSYDNNSSNGVHHPRLLDVFITPNLLWNTLISPSRQQSVLIMFSDNLLRLSLRKLLLPPNTPE